MTTNAPSDLDAAGAELWRSVTAWSHEGARLELRPDELAVLAQACRVADTIDRLERDLDGAPALTEGSKGQTVVHPGLVEIRHQRAALASLLRQLALPDTTGEGWDNLTAAQRARKAAVARWSA